MTDEETRVVEAARVYVAAKRRTRQNQPDPLPPKVEGEPSALDAFFIAEGELFEAVDKLP